MSEQTRIQLYQQQTGAKPVIEGVIPIVIADGAKKKLALDFIAWLRENKMQPQWGGLIQSWQWKFNYKSKTILIITMSENGWIDYEESSWFVIPLPYPYNDIKKHSEAIIKNNLQGIIQNNQCFCVHKNKDGRTGVGCDPQKACAGGMTKNVFDRDIEGICCGGGSERPNTRFYDPGETEIYCIKKLLELEKKARDDEAAVKKIEVK